MYDRDTVELLLLALDEGMARSFGRDPWTPPAWVRPLPAPAGCGVCLPPQGA